MRSIKFRAWHEQGFMIPSDNIISISFEYENEYVEWGMLEYFSRKDTRSGNGEVELMQFTGLHDKNGTEIYEGDIVEWCDYDTIRPIVWNDKKGWFAIDDYDSGLTALSQQLDNVRVIGNIYENPRQDI